MRNFNQLLFVEGFLLNSLALCFPTPPVKPLSPGSQWVGYPVCYDVIAFPPPPPPPPPPLVWVSISQCAKLIGWIIRSILLAIVQLLDQVHLVLKYHWYCADICLSPNSGYSSCNCATSILGSLLVCPSDMSLWRSPEGNVKAA